MNLDSLLETVEIYRQMIEHYEPCTLVLCDKEKFLYVHDALGLNMRAGDALTPGSGTHTALIQNQTLVRLVDAGHSVYAKVGYMSVCIPIRDASGEAVGVLSWGISENRTRLAEMSQELSAIVQELGASSEEFAGHANRLLEANQALTELTSKLEEQMELIERISAGIANVSSQSHLLGLNASIEAAHAGEHGRGFAIVAGEIRKLAVEAGKSVDEIKEQVEGAKNQMRILMKETEGLRLVSANQASGASQIAAAIGRVNELAGGLSSLAQRHNELVEN